MSRFERIEIDERLIDALKRRERAAAEAVYRTLAPAVFTLARRLLADAQLAKEATQDTFVHVIERADTVKEPAAFVGWVRTVTVNQCLMRLRSPWRLRRTTAEPEHADAASDTARLDALCDVERALARLSSDARFVVWMHDVEGYTHGQIGNLTGKSASYSKSQLARAYAELLAWSSGSGRRMQSRRGVEGNGIHMNSRRRFEEVHSVDANERTLVEGVDETTPGEGGAELAHPS